MVFSDIYFRIKGERITDHTKNYEKCDFGRFSGKVQKSPDFARKQQNGMFLTNHTENYEKGDFE